MIALSGWVIAGQLLAASVGAMSHPIPVADDVERRALQALGGLLARDEGEVISALVSAEVLGLQILDPALVLLAERGTSRAVRARAVSVLAASTWPTHAVELDARVNRLGRLLFDADPVIRAGAAAGLGRYSTPLAQQLLAVRYDSASDDERVGLSAARMAMRGPASIERLAQWLGRPGDATVVSGVPRTWRLALAASRLVADPRASDALDLFVLLQQAEDPGLVRPILVWATLEGDRVLRRHAIESLASHPSEVDIPLLAALLGASEAPTRGAAASALGNIVAPTACAALVARLAVEEDVSVAGAIAAALRLQDTEALCEALMPVLQGPPRHARDFAVSLVSERTGSASIAARTLVYAIAPNAALLAALRAEDGSSRLQRLLPRLTAPDVIRDERLAVIEVLDDLEDGRWVRALGSLMSVSEDPRVVESAGRRLARRDEAQAVARASRLVADGDDAHQRVGWDLLLAQTTPEARARVREGIAAERDPALVAHLMAHAHVGSDPELQRAVMARLGGGEQDAVVVAALGSLRGTHDALLAPTLVQWVREPGRAVRGADRDHTEHIRELALQRLEELDGGAAAAAMRELALDDRMPRDVRVRAMGMVARHGTRADASLLAPGMASDDAEVRYATRRTLHALAPDEYGAWDAYGRGPLVASAGCFGGLLLWLTSELSGERHQALLASTGVVVGSGTAYMFARDADLSLGEAGYFATLGLWGTLGGYGLGALWPARDGVHNRALWAAAAGEMVGVTVGALTVRKSRLTLGSALLANAAALSAGGAAVSLAYLGRADGDAGPLAVLGAGGLIGSLPLVLLAGQLRLDAATLGVVGAVTGLGAFLGGFAPSALLRDSRSGDVLAGIGVGQAVGLGSGLTLAALTHVERSTLVWSTLGAATGATLGGGLGLAMPRLGRRVSYGLVDAGTLLGVVVLGASGPRLQFHETDIALVTLLTGGGAFSGARMFASGAERAGVPGARRDGRANVRLGGAMMGGALGLAGGLGVSQAVDLSTGELVLTGAAGGIVGAGAAGLALLVPAIDDVQLSVYFSAGAGVAGLGTALIAERLRYAPPDAALAVSSAALGTFLGSFVPAYWTAEGDALVDSERAGGAMLGGALGTLFAAGVSQLADMEPHRVAKVDLGALGGMAIGAGAGLVVPQWGRRPTVGMLHSGALLGYGLASVSERRSHYDGADRAHLVLGTTVGAGYGLLAPDVWRKRRPASDAYREERQGGLLLGAGLGFLGTRLRLRDERLEAGDVFEVGVTAALAGSVGHGAWGLVQAPRRTRHQLLAGTGLAGWVGAELLAAHTTWSPADMRLLAFGVGVGAVGGAALPELLARRTIRERDRRSGVALGAGSLGLATYALAPWTEYEGDDLAEAGMTAMLVATSAFGAGDARTTERVLLRRADAGWWLGVGAGLAASPWTSFSDDDAVWMTGAGALGAWLGYQQPVVRQGQDAARAWRRRQAAGGASMAMLASGLALQLVDWPMDWAMQTMTLATAATLTAQGVGTLDVVQGDRRQARSLQVASLSGAIVGGLLAPWVPMSERDVGLMATLGGLGAWQGYWFGVAWGGVGAGWLVGYALAPFVDRTGDDHIELVWGTTLGSAAGAGWAGLRNFGISARAHAIGAGGLVGMGVAALVSPWTQYHDSALVLMSGATMWGGWQGLWLADLVGVDAASRQRRQSGALLGAAAGLGIASLGGRLVERTPGDVVESSAWLVAGNLMGGGGALLGLAGRRTERAWVLGGGFVGLGVGLGLSPRTSYDAADPLLVAVLAGVGASHGGFAAAALSDDDDADERLAGGLELGAGLGLAGGMLVAQRLSFGRGDVGELVLATLAGDALGLGVSQILGAGRRAAAWTAASGLALGGLSLATANATSYDRIERRMIAVGAIYGSWAGGWAPHLWQSPDDGGYGLVAGGALGALIAAGASQAVTYAPQDLTEVVLASSTASAFGAGLGLLASRDDRWWVGLMEASGAIGTAAALVGAPRLEISTDDALAGALAAIYGLYQGAGLSLLLDGSDRQVTGGMLAAGTGGLLLGTVVGRYLHLDKTDMLMLSAGSAWGILLGVFTAAVADEETRHHRGVLAVGVGTTALATDVMLAATSLAISEIVRMPGERFAWISVGGGLGLAGGAVGAALAGGTPGRYKRGVLYGSLGGLVVGTVATGFFDFAPRVDATFDADGNQTSGMGLWPELAMLMPTVQYGATEPFAPTHERSQMLFMLTGLYL